ncbi:MAG TPA: DNA primase [bacterium]|nr:DNA primase [bacterium]
MATERDLELIRERTSIVDLVSSHTRLKKVGHRFKGLCPFHSEKDGSFYVDEERKLWHCFGCGVGGDVFSFVMQTENVSFGEAVEILAKRAGVEITPATQVDSGRKKIKDKVLKINELSTVYFYKVLTKSRAGEKFLSYLDERGVTKEQIKSFKLGATLDSWDGLIRALAKKDFNARDIAQAGLALEGQRGFYDRFRDRLMFPLFNIVGDVVGFAGRAYGDAMPKYMNTPETPLFDKGRMVYALDIAKKNVGGHGIILTEGYMDVIALHRAGIKCAVASMGTALTPQQVDLIKRYAEKVVLSYDSDFAGDSATMRGIEMLVDRGIDIRVVSLPQGEDPDSIVTVGGAEAFYGYLEKAQDYFNFFVAKSMQRSGSESPAQKRDVIMQMATLIEKTPNEILRDQQVKVLAESLGISEQHVHSALSQVKSSTKRGVSGKEVDTEAIDNILSGSMNIEKKIIELLLAGVESAEMILEQLSAEDFEDDRNRVFFEYCLKYRENNNGFSPDEFLESVHPQEVITFISGVPLAGGEQEGTDEKAEDVLVQFKKESRKKQIAVLRKKAEQARKAGDKKLENKLAIRIAELLKEMHERK